jgi:hypothetical protein
MKERSMCSSLALRVRVGWSALLITGGALAAALPAEAQSTLNNAVQRQSWTAEVTTGVLVQPVSGGGTGGAVAITLGRAAPRGIWSPSILLAAARVGDVRGPARDNEYIVDRDWGITAVGVDAFVARTERLAVSLGAKGGVLWNHDRQAGVRGTPLGQFGPTDWEAKAGLIIDGAARYRIRERLSLASRMGLVQHVFTDDLIGPSGALVSLGLAFSW